MPPGHPLAGAKYLHIKLQKETHAQNIPLDLVVMMPGLVSCA